MYSRQSRRRVARRDHHGSSLRGLSWTNRLKDISLTASAGEIVGLGGLDGQGQRELLLALFGALSGLTGEIRIEGRPSPSAARGRRKASEWGWR